ncbi:ABC transporter family protein [Paraburkholderia xenovorans LB400]|uniref:Amino acid/amide ABC transporter ATP-binding protein 1, HAAT family n=1 Tax=Paraburkholderia xenovorans (strain LB400) TaxID=266265 RepID=Q13GP6_PARXL|nr:ABC transporter ATP-binding protein [Paraburkholderia xenovorans]ABE36743.1 amino acid/amide ABC transporter ATP-binding protein 1, HAAT family [Paraburkholderia xenovorans LB400]AIP33993.1 ABC transporter family protein [Paraburkholderia xenovorans LB400]
MALLEVNHLTKRFGGLTAVNDVSFSVDEHQILGVIGPNGAGKSTLFTLLTGFTRPSAGEWSIAGVSLHGRNPEQICKAGIVRTFQIVQPFWSMSVFENAMVAAVHRSRSRAQARELAEESLAWVGLSAKRDYPIGSLTIADKKALEMAKACASGARVILLDEVMAGLRPGEVDRVVQTVLTLRRERGLTFLVVEHHMDAVMTLSDQILVLNFGALLAKGTPEQIQRDTRVQEAYLGVTLHA